ncbi:MAG TPA: tetratricopeptide repeat protein [Tepidisphaeraceae bacterium]|nr:tetratricopeptide repeat protein [Tepidisphaeraceae bacterium]
MTAQQTLVQAFQEHQAGRVQQAEVLYRQVLSEQPEHADALHALGVARLQQGSADEAIGLLQRAISLDPTQAQYHANLAGILFQLGRSELAISHYRRAVALRPEAAEWQNNLGNALMASRQFTQAIDAYQRAMAIRPDYVEAIYNLGAACGASGRFDQAIDALKRTVELRPDYPEAFNNLGNALSEKHQHAQALEYYHKAISLRPYFAETYNNLGIALHKLNRFDEAIAAYRESMRLRPGKPEVHYHLANAFKDKGEREAAAEEARQAIALRPDYAEAYITLSALLVDVNRWDEAMDVARKAIAVRPNWAGGYNNLGLMHRMRGQHAEALDLLRRALSQDPHFREALVNLGSALHESGKLDEAMDAYRHAVTEYPDSVEAQVNLGNALKDAGQIDQAIAAYRKSEAIKPDAPPAENLLLALNYSPSYTPEQILQEHLSWGRAITAAAGEPFHSHDNDRNPDRRLRIGYVSGDFRLHIVGYNVLPLLERHDRRAFQIFGYSNVVCPDALTDRFRSLCDGWRDVKGLTDAQLAKSVRDDGIDVLVDLAVHTADNRLTAFARKPAPVQVSFAGYPGTTGLKQVDYRLTDRFLDPPNENDAYYAERSYRLEDSFWCYRPVVSPIPPVSDLPALTSGYVTFGCLNNFCKINPPVLELWARVLRSEPTAQLILIARQGSHRRRAIELLQIEGINPGRIEFLDYQPLDGYLRTHHRIDIGLDTFPYNGHTTSLDSLWMGVPVVTLVGRTAVARAGWCQLGNLGLSELAAHDPGQFVQIATSLANDLPRLAALRAGLRQRMENSPLMDCDRFTRNIERGYRQMWRTWCSDGGSHDPAGV